MPGHAWIIRNGYHHVVEGKPRGWKGWPLRFQDLSHAVGMPIGYAPPIVDDLTWGPHDADLRAQRRLRSCYHRSTLEDDERGMELCLEKLQNGDDLLLWGEPRVGSCLCMLWVVDWLHARGGDLSRVFLVLQPVPHHQTVSLQDFHARLAARIPVAALATAMIDVRRRLASDSDEIAVDASAFSDDVRQWVELGNHLRDLLPDERGLDRFDDRLLEHLSDDWQRAAWPVGNSQLFLPSYLAVFGERLWHRLVELSDKQGLQSMHAYAMNVDRSLCELRTEGWAGMPNSWVKISRLGKNVRSGRSDALKHRQFHRWVGGRLITNDRLIRRPGSYRDKSNRGTHDPKSISSNQIK